MKDVINKILEITDLLLVSKIEEQLLMCDDIYQTSLHIIEEVSGYNIERIFNENDHALDLSKLEEYIKLLTLKEELKKAAVKAERKP